VEITCGNVTGLQYFDSIPDIFPGNDVGISPILKKSQEWEGVSSFSAYQVNENSDSRSF
jgi:hypothetical protein